MWARRKILTACLWLALGSVSAFASAQSDSRQPKTNPAFGKAFIANEPQLTPILPKIETENISIHVVYEGVVLENDVTLTVTLSKPNPSGITSPSMPILAKTLFLDTLYQDTEIVLAIPKATPTSYIDAVVRDKNQNILLQAQQPIAVRGAERLTLNLLANETIQNPVSERIGVEKIAGTIKLPRDEHIPPGSSIHIQLIEDALAGGISMSLAAEHVIMAVGNENKIDFNLTRDLWNTQGTPSLVFRVWSSDPFGRKIFIMPKPVHYKGPNVNYTIRLDSLKQGRETITGEGFSPILHTQTLVRGEASFDPVNGIPGEARLKIELKQDRGTYNQNSILTEQTLILRSMETQIPFTLATDSAHFDPYVPPPFISISLTDKFGRIYYESGDVRAQEGPNQIRLYPQ